MTSATFDFLQDLIARDYEKAPESLTPGTLLTDLAIDSLAQIELIFTLEDHFKVTADNVPPTFTTLGSVADFIDQLVAQRDARDETAKPA